EMSNVAGDENFYSTVSHYAKSLGYTMTVGNPGTDTLSSYIGTVDNLMIYENPGLPALSALEGWHTSYDKSNFSMIAFGVSSISTSFLASASNYVGYIYLTNDNLPNPYDSIPSYFGSLVADLDTGSSTTSAPQPPTNLSTTVVSSSQINLSWVASSNNGGSAITGYKIDRSTNNGSTWSTLVANTGSTGTAYSDTGLASNTTYTYRVSAINSVGTSSPSGMSSATTGSNATPPQSPTNLAASTISSSQINLSWTASANGGSAITGYKVDRSIDSGITWNTIASNTASTATLYSDIGLLANTTYTYRVSAINGIGTSLPSNVTSATTVGVNATVPQSPTGLTSTAISSSQINLSWSAPSNNGGSAVLGYEVDRSTNNGSTWSTLVANTGSTGTAYSDTGLVPSTTYTYRASAINSIGTSSVSNTTSATTNATTTNGIALSNTMSTSGTVSPSNRITISNFNAGHNNNGLLVVGVSANNNDVASITFGGVQLKNAAYSFYNNDAELWYLKNPSGTGNVVVTMNGPTQAVVGVYSLSGVDQTTPIPTHGIKHNTNANSPKISLTTKYANDWVLDLPSIYGGSTLSNPTCTQHWDNNVSNQITGASSSAIVSTPGAVTCGWTASSGDLWDDVVVEINAAR
ncbi:MAG TPA: fibronectin type III domain-containing protein, partial [Candidatus Nitrosotalea sp.]|nr:fibronectin type III domain-containing protein [Candidatus Nitrosotalea sp.]